MNLHIIAIGKKKSEYEDMIKEYQKRISQPFELTIDVFSSSEKIIKSIKQLDYVVALDEFGKGFTTKEFSLFIEKQLTNSVKRIVFVIGDSYGLTPDIRERANLTLCLGLFTLPHELARIIIVEQLYRATNIISGGKYHHE